MYSLYAALTLADDNVTYPIGTERDFRLREVEERCSRV